MHWSPDVSGWKSLESHLDRAAAAITHLTSSEAGEEDILAAEIHYRRVWESSQRGSLLPRSGHERQVDRGRPNGWNGR